MTDAEPFLGEIGMVAFEFAPRGWALCNGQLLPINQNQALFSLLGTRFGGNGTTNFALPDLRNRVPVHPSSPAQPGQAGGAASHTLTGAEMPVHTHGVNASLSAGNQVQPAGAVLASTSGLYAPPTAPTALAPATVALAGGGQAHENRQPFLNLHFVIRVQPGAFPSPT